jgi:hypothetical protein
MSTMIPRGNLVRLAVVSVVLSPAQVAANTTAEQTFTVPGVRPNDFLMGVSKPTSQAGIGVVNARVSAASQVAITFSNNTAGAITPTASETYQLLMARSDSTVGAFV